MSDTTSTLAEVAAALVATMGLQPKMAERFVAAWLAEWAQDGHEPSDTLERVNQRALNKRLERFMSRRVAYLTTEQQAEVVMANLPVTAGTYHLRQCIAALKDQVGPRSADLLQSASEALEVLSGMPLYSLLRELAPIKEPSGWDTTR